MALLIRLRHSRVRLRAVKQNFTTRDHDFTLTNTRE
jgi:hypothetical protein